MDDDSKMVSDITPLVEHITEKSVTENAMRNELLTFLALTSSATSDEPFFNKLARYLAQCLEMDYVCIDRLEGDGLTATTVAVWNDGHFEDTVSYALKDTPCGNVVGQTVCCFPSMVCNLFPNDQVLHDLKAESYIGVTLWGHTGEPIGLIAVISRQPLKNRSLAESVMQMVAIRAAGEIERLDAKKALLDSEKKYRELFQSQPNGYAFHEIIADSDGNPIDYRFLETNPLFDKLTGLKADDLIGKTLLEVMPNSEPYWIQAYGRVALTGEPISFENFSKELNRHYQVTAYSPEPGKFTTVFHDITERKLAEEALQKSEAKFSKAFNASPVLIAITSLDDGRYVEVNDVFYSTTGYQKDEVIGHTSLELGIWLDPNDRQIYLAELSKGSTRNREYKFRMRNGEIRYFLVSSEVFELDGKRCGLNFIIDVTHMKQVENELRTLAEDLNDSQRIAHVGSWRLDSVSNEVKWTEELYKMYGFDPTLPPPPYTEHRKLFTAESWKRLSSSLQNTQNTGIPYDLELETVRDDGSSGWMWVYGEPVLDENGAIVGLRGMAQDITDVKSREIALKASETKYRMLLDNLAAGVVVHASDSSIIFSNTMASTLLGLSEEQMMGKVAIDPAWSFVRENGSAMPLEEYPVNQVLKSGKPLCNFTLGFCHPDLSDPLWGLCNAYPVKNSEGCLEQVVVVFSDITKLKKAEADSLLFEQQIQQTQRLDSLGVLAGGIAHDFNNILAIIVGYCSLIKMDYETAESNIPEIEKAAERAAALCRQMLAYAGKAQVTKTQVNMWALVDEMVSMLKATLPQNAVIKPNLSADIPYINADASQLRQVVMNLIINASEAIGTNQGEITISLSTTKVYNGQEEIDHQGKAIPSGRYICLSITDDGCGMDEETKWRLFEPFFTTKFSGRGLGMSAVQGIINSHGGMLQLFTQLGQGTTFKVYLPVPPSDPSEMTGQDNSIASTPWQGNGTILLVEDEDQVRFLAKRILEMIGFNVLEAVNGREALEIYQSNAAEIRLVLTDMGMPVMDGYALFPALKQLNHNLPVIISSGFGDTDVVSRIGRDNIAGMIRKPYNPDQLRELLKRVLEGGG